MKLTLNDALFFGSAHRTADPAIGDDVNFYVQPTAFLSQIEGDDITKFPGKLQNPFHWLNCTSRNLGRHHPRPKSRIKTAQNPKAAQPEVVLIDDLLFLVSGLSKVLRLEFELHGVCLPANRDSFLSQNVNSRPTRRDYQESLTSVEKILTSNMRE